MVQILRDQTRQYAANQTEAIKTAQVAQNLQEVGQVIDTGLSVASRIAGIQEQKEKKQQEQDKRIIQNEIGNRANQEISDWAKTQSWDYLNSPEGRSEIEKRSTEVYNRYSDSVSTQYGRDVLANMRRKYADSLIGQASRNVGDENALKAKQAVENLQKQMQFDATKYGRNWDIEGYNIDSQTSEDAIVDYKVSQGLDEEIARAGVRSQRAIGFLTGALETKPEFVASVIGDEESERAILDYRIREQFPDASDEQVSDMVDSAYEKAKSDSKSQEELKSEIESLLGTGTIDYYKKNKIELLKNEKNALQEEYKLAQGKHKNHLKKQIDDITARIEDDGNTAGIELFQQDARMIFKDQVYKRIKQQQQMLKQQKYDNVVNTYTAGLSPDFLENASARMYIDTVIKGEKPNQTYVNEPLSTQSPVRPEQNMTPINKELQRSVRDEIQIDQLNAAASEFFENSKKVKPNFYGTYQGTVAMNNALNDLLDNIDGTPMQIVEKAYQAMNKAWNAPITDEEYDTFQDIVYNITKDSSFGNEVAQVFKNSDRFYPDTTWLANTFAIKPEKEFAVANGDTSSNAIRRSDIDTAQNRYESGLTGLFQASMRLMAEASKIQVPEVRAQAMKQVEDFIIQERGNLYNDLMSNYGINLRALDEQLDKKGYAFTQLGFSVYEYKGRDDKGNPLFSRSIPAKIEKAEQERLMRELSNTGNNKETGGNNG